MEIVLVLLVVGFIGLIVFNFYVYRGSYSVPVLSDNGIRIVNVASYSRQESYIKSILGQIKRITTQFWDTDANGASTILDREWEDAERKDSTIQKLACAVIERSLLIGDTRGWIRKPEGWNPTIWEPIVRTVLDEELAKGQLRQLA